MAGLADFLDRSIRLQVALDLRALIRADLFLQPLTEAPILAPAIRPIIRAASSRLFQLVVIRQVNNV